MTVGGVVVMMVSMAGPSGVDVATSVACVWIGAVLLVEVTVPILRRSLVTSVGSAASTAGGSMSACGLWRLMSLSWHECGGVVLG